MLLPRSGGDIVLPLSVRLSFRPSSFVVVFSSPQLLLKYLMQGFETFNTAQTCIEHVHKGNRVLIQSLLQNYVPLNDMHILTISYCSTVRISATPSTVFNAGI